MVVRYDPIIYENASKYKVPFSVIKSFVETTTDFDPFYYERNKSLWHNNLKKNKQTYVEMYIKQFINSKQHLVKPTDKELGHLYGAYYGFMKIPVFVAYKETSFAGNPFELLNIEKNLEVGCTILAKYKSYYPHVTNDIAWGLASIAYFIGDPLRIMGVVDRVQKTTLKDQDKPFVYITKIKKEFGPTGAQYAELFENIMSGIRKYKKQELTFMTGQAPDYQEDAEVAENE